MNDDAMTSADCYRAARNELKAARVVRDDFDSFIMALEEARRYRNMARCRRARPLTAARLREIAKGIRASRGWGDKSVTTAEDAEIKTFWRTLPGSSSYFGAVCALAEKQAGT